MFARFIVMSKCAAHLVELIVFLQWVLGIRRQTNTRRDYNAVPVCFEPVFSNVGNIDAVDMKSILHRLGPVGSQAEASA